MSVITHSADTRVVLPTACVLLFVLLWRRELRAAAFVAMTTIVAVSLRLVVLNPVDRPRPAARYPPPPVGRIPPGNTTAAAAVVAVVVVLGRTVLAGRRARVGLTACVGRGPCLSA
jgi:hypothetical protein